MQSLQVSNKSVTPAVFTRTRHNTYVRRVLPTTAVYLLIRLFLGVRMTTLSNRSLNEDNVFIDLFLRCEVPIWYAIVPHQRISHIRKEAAFKRTASGIFVDVISYRVCVISNH